jgi:hypothetical protein
MKWITHCQFNEENLAEIISYGNWTFEILELIKRIAIIKKDLKSDWATILN